MGIKVYFLDNGDASPPSFALTGGAATATMTTGIAVIRGLTWSGSCFC
jgi:hypothetical protein